ncbi:MAG: DUF2911 domain-containing protein [Saprospiraceae bacterium]|nr:DUF2911 domain-containing protein [Saprospiraceae bacterium]
MKNLITICMLSTMVVWASAAIAQERRAPSPASTLSQKVGLTDVTIEYSRPSMKGRTIMGELVPYDAGWRTGANSATKITFSDAVTVDGKELAAGSYALMTKPGMESWEVHFHTYGESGAGSYAGKDPAVKVMVEPVALECTVETFLINIDELRDNSATLQLIWEQTLVPVSLGVK